MSARTGEQYRAGLKDSREVWLGNEQIDITEHPAFQGSINGMAAYFDYQHKYAADCLMQDAETGEEHNVSLLRPHNAEDIARRHRAFDRLARYSNGMLGRTPDYVNVVLAGHASRPDIFAKSGDPVYYERLQNYWRLVQEQDLALTHTIVHAAIDKSVGELQGINEELTLRVVERTDEGLIVRGAKMLATLGPIADELYVYPAVPIQKGYEEYALSFAIPVATKGVVSVCRDHYGVDQPIVDKPFSSRFDEQDAVIIFDDVLIPWDRVFIDGQLDVYNSLNAGTATGNTQQQTAIRASVKLEFAYDLCVQMAKVTATDTKPETASMLGEIYSYLRIARAVIHSAEVNASEWGGGAFFCHDDISSLRTMMPLWMARVNDIIKSMGSHNLLATPTAAAFEETRLGPLLKKYLPGANGILPEERAKIFRTAWDFAGSALGSRNELYERFYLGSIGRARALDHKKAQMKGETGAYEAMFAEAGIFPTPVADDSLDLDAATARA
ncbi:4-hydroxyphenylacetate 3-hydroxylase N-terminal domain-containing protein [Glutamicibacter sp.]|uniref:4-hydroxyphenylacetate 3-hydroxylase N-terminal domain-containing protein n=1 Tax=Glutamicibacter sp. TaxID=1931995 RepID=UPI002B484524|nr:4-hydroxyphenylacetate 3-hydroxylase N-terminal domain-containing protein [Glutamicibacter sp.]HJX76745.1 4-hydroxyphenylacetate 3-hydroxylase N-terminal domain-containing protein [Glutamicibacter sp.]